MEIVGKIILALPEAGGTSRAGNVWRKREYVLETYENFPKKVHFHFFGDRIDQYPLNVGDTIKLSFDISSREFNGRWYTDISGWKAEPADSPMAAAATQAPAPAAAPAAMPGGYDAPPAAPFVSEAGPNDGLPF